MILMGVKAGTCKPAEERNSVNALEGKMARMKDHLKSFNMVFKEPTGKA